MTDKGGRPRLLFVITEDWTFWEIRRDLARIALNAGYEVTIATRVTAHAERIRQEGFHLVPIKMLRESRNPIRELLTFLELIRVYRRVCPQIVQHVAMKPVLYGSFAAWVTRIPAVINVFGGLGYAFTDRAQETSVLRSILQRGLRRSIALSRSVVVVQNPDDRNVLVREHVVTSSQVRLIAGSGVDIHRFVPADPPVGDPIVMLVGRMLWDKGVGEFIDAVARLKQRDVHARFVLVGRCDKGNPTAIAEAQLQQWTKDHGIEWWGHREDLPEVIGRATLVVLPSYREGLPKVLLEAAACGKAVIATDVPGCREVVQHQKTGLLVPARDPVALANAIASLLTNHDLRKVMGASGREFVMREHSKEKIGQHFLDLYQECLGLAGNVSGVHSQKTA